MLVRGPLISELDLHVLYMTYTCMCGSMAWMLYTQMTYGMYIGKCSIIVLCQIWANGPDELYMYFFPHKQSDKQSSWPWFETPRSSCPIPQHGITCCNTPSRYTKHGKTMLKSLLTKLDKYRANKSTAIVLIYSPIIYWASTSNVMFVYVYL